MDENYFELGLGARIDNHPSIFYEESVDTGTYILINGFYQWKGFFLEGFGESRDPLIVGYNAINLERMSFDIVGGVQHGFPNDEEKFDGLEDRYFDFFLGGRLTTYLPEGLAQFQLRKDVSGRHGGILVSALYGSGGQYRNWNFHYLYGIEYRSKEIDDYYWGVSEEESQNTDFAQYSGHSSLVYTAELGVTYPITENWVFRTSYRYNYYTNVKSSLYLNTNKNASLLAISLSYVF